MVPLGVAHPAAREATPVVPRLKRPPERRRDCPRAPADIERLAIPGVAQHHAGRVTGQAPGRFRGNADAVLERGLARLVRVGQHGGVHVGHHLVPLAPRAGIESLLEGRLRHQREGVGLLLARASKDRVPRRIGDP